jgi:hypothetical protein
MFFIVDQDDDGNAATQVLPYLSFGFLTVMEQMRQRLAPAFANSSNDVTIIGAGTSHLDPRQAGSFVCSAHRYSDAQKKKSMDQRYLAAVARDEPLPFEAALL